MKPIPATERNILEAADVVRRGGLVAFPTETVYGLGADALNPVAVARIFEAKKRPFFDPLIVHIAELSALAALAGPVGGRIEALINALWPGPLTVVLPRTGLVPDIVTAGLDTVAVRMPSHPVARSLIAAAGTPIAAPSANLFGYLSPTRAEHVEKQLGGMVDIILDGGPCSVGVESTIVKFTVDGVCILRPGGVPAEEIARIAGPLLDGVSRGVEAPGQLPGHYSPRVPVVIVRGVSEAPSANAAYLAFRETPLPGRFDAVEVLSPEGDLREAAARLFTALHALDRSGAGIIYAEAVPETGLGVAIMDRLRRASQKNP